MLYVTTILASLALLGPTAAKTIIWPMPFSEIVKKSELIFTGTVQKQFCRMENQGQTIRTYVVLSTLGVRKGTAGATVTLRFEGGSVGDHTLRVPAMPLFQTGKSYLCYVRGNGKNFSAITGFHQGVFELAIRKNRQVLITQSGHELVGVKDDRFVLAPKPAQKTARKTKQTKLKLQFIPGSFRQGNPRASELERQRTSTQRTPRLPLRPVPLARPQAKSLARSQASLPSRSQTTKSKTIQGVPVKESKSERQLGQGNKPPRIAPPILLHPSRDKGHRMNLQALLTQTAQAK